MENTVVPELDGHRTNMKVWLLHSTVWWHLMMVAELYGGKTWVRLNVMVPKHHTGRTCKMVAAHVGSKNKVVSHHRIRIHNGGFLTSTLVVPRLCQKLTE